MQFISSEYLVDVEVRRLFRSALFASFFLPFSSLHFFLLSVLCVKDLIRERITCRMVELDRQRESLRKRRLVQGLGSFLEEQAFMLLRQSRLSQEDNRSLWQELIYAELYASDSRRLGHCGARAA